jgi:hypothetical protein
MAFDILIDPVTRDFVDTDDGEWEETDDSRTAVFCELDSRGGKWWGDPTAGSENAEIMESELPTPEALLDSTKRSMRKLVGAGVLSDAFVNIEEHDNSVGRVTLYLQWKDRASSRPADLVYSALGGKPRV